MEPIIKDSPANELSEEQLLQDQLTAQKEFILRSRAVCKELGGSMKRHMRNLIDEDAEFIKSKSDLYTLEK